MPVHSHIIFHVHVLNKIQWSLLYKTTPMRDHLTYKTTPTRDHLAYKTTPPIRDHLAYISPLRNITNDQFYLRNLSHKTICLIRPLFCQADLITVNPPRRPSLASKMCRKVVAKHSIKLTRSLKLVKWVVCLSMDLCICLLCLPYFIYIPYFAVSMEFVFNSLFHDLVMGVQQHVHHTS